jgi:hypothetical protein
MGWSNLEKPNFNGVPATAWWCLAMQSKAWGENGQGASGVVDANHAFSVLNKAGKLHAGFPPKDLQVQIFWTIPDNSGSITNTDTNGYIGGHVVSSIGDGYVYSTWGDNKWHKWTFDDANGVIHGSFPNASQPYWSEAVLEYGKIYQVVKWTDEPKPKLASPLFKVGDWVTVSKKSTKQVGGDTTPPAIKGYPFVIQKVTKKTWSHSAYAYTIVNGGGWQFIIAEQDLIKDKKHTPFKKGTTLKVKSTAEHSVEGKDITKHRNTKHKVTANRTKDGANQYKLADINLWFWDWDVSK